MTGGEFGLPYASPTRRTPASLVTATELCIVAQRESEQRLQLHERRAGIDHLDRRDAERARGLQIEPDIVEEHGVRRLDAELPTRQLEDARVRLPQTDGGG